MRSDSILIQIMVWTFGIVMVLFVLSTPIARWAGVPVGMMTLAITQSVLIVGAAIYLWRQIAGIPPFVAVVWALSVILLWAVWWPVLWAAGVDRGGPYPWAPVPWWLSPWVHWGVPAALVLAVVAIAWRRPA